MWMHHVEHANNIFKAPTFCIYVNLKLFLDKLIKLQQFWTIYLWKGFVTWENHEVENVGLFDDVGIIMEGGKKLIWYLGHVQKIIKQLDKGGHVDYVRLVQLNEGITILPKYYKHDWKSLLFIWWL